MHSLVSSIRLYMSLFSRIKINRRCPILSHMLFVDDTILFAKPDVEEASRAKLLLDKYQLASGQLINYAKCGIIFIV
ncbi:conserved hypothetical protein [Ricinus communis]|uniref:Reverse transcriptase domain-containing protein n=1 Tax=Ricinus communis TaxID=3988 RepID=B9SD40_RICCO|nr:conserved hypothetical protein [Ricinus communis]